MSSASTTARRTAIRSSFRPSVLFTANPPGFASSFDRLHALLDHLVGPQQHRLRNRQPEGLRRLEVDDQLELGGLLDGEIGRLGALEDLVHVSGRAPKDLGIAGPVPLCQRA